ncbi:MAG: hypothetical protein IPP29_14705 [Bacteroidetes bacterium]|nr:hypothetical protein [Bacteroidota bacterium]
MVKTLLTGTLLLITLTCFGQQKIGQWRVHLSYNQTKAITVSPTKIYVGANDAVFYYDKENNEIKTLSKVEGLSSIGINTLKYNDYNKCLLIAYSDANIDLLKGKTIINISDIKRKNIIGGKNINNIHFKNEFAYVSCSFGIVVINTDRNEVKETYTLGSTNSNIKIWSCTTDDNYIYAASDSGVYRATLTDPFIVNPTAWQKVFAIKPGSGGVKYIANFNNKIFANQVQTTTLDSLYIMDIATQQWSGFAIGANETQTKLSMQSSGDVLTLTSLYFVHTIDKNFNVTTYNNTNIAFTTANDAAENNGNIWIADANKGLIKYTPQQGSEIIVPSGPRSNKVALIDGSENNIWIGHGPRFNNWAPAGVVDGFAKFDNTQWTTFHGNAPGNSFSLDTVEDLICIAADPSNKNHVYFGSWGRGLVEYDNGTIKLYNDANSPIKVQQFIANYRHLRIGGLALDQNNNLWMTNTLSDSGLIVKKNDGTWKKFYVPLLSGGDYVTDIIADDYNQLWINVPISGANNTGILVYNHNGTIDNVSDDRVRLLSDEEGKGQLPSKAVRCMARDQDGLIWAGTEKGVGVFYSPSSVFSGGNYDAQQILIVQETYNLYLLDKEVVQAINIDGANRKWFGTQSGGAFLTSPDGVNQVLNFNETNSPLLSNNIYSIKVNDATGEVFFSTDRGLISYQGDATQGSAACENVLVYPNPVRENYEGPIAIRGLVNNGNVKITDVSGNLVFETQSLGGQAIWYGKNLKGEKVYTGVYLLFCSDADGTNTCITKLLFVR